MRADPAVLDLPADLAAADEPPGHGFTVLRRHAGRLAVWTRSSGGVSAGAWVESETMSADRAWQLLTVVERRVLIGVDQVEDLSALAVLTNAAGHPPVDPTAVPWLDVFTGFTAVRELRVLITAEGGRPPAYKKLCPELPDDVPAALRDLGLTPPSPPEPSAAAALGVTWLLMAAIAAWQDTETSRVRRRALDGLGGKSVRLLPPAWVECLRQAENLTFRL